MKVPILRIPFDEADRQFIREGMDAILDSGMLTMGRFTEEFEAQFAEMAGARHAIACSSGTAALELILRGLGLQGCDVIVPTNTFIASAFSVMHSGNRVVFADSDPATLCLDPEDVARRLTLDTAAVMLVHIGGVIPPAVDALRRLCETRGLILLEDCAHAHGCSLNGKAAGTWGAAGAFSFFPTKALTTGEGGVVATNDDALAARIRAIRNHGKDPAQGNRIAEFGSNLRITETAALLGVLQVRKSAALFADRRRAAAFYGRALADVPGLRPLKLPDGLHSTYYKYVCYLDERLDRATIKRRLREEFGVALTGEVYAELCHAEPVWRTYTYCGQRREGPATCARWPACRCSDVQDGFPGADYISRHHICLPLYPGLTDHELGHTVAALRRTVTAVA